MKLKRLAKSALLPWHSLFLDAPGGAALPYFGPPTHGFGGPDLKVRKLKQHFGNSWGNANIIYVVSGKPLPLDFLTKAKARGRHVILNQDGVYYPAWFKGDWRRENEILKRYHELADRVIFQSHFCLESAKRFIAPPERPSEILYNGVDTELFRPDPAKSVGPAVKILSAAYYNPSNDYALRALFAGVRRLADRKINCRLLLAGKIHTGGISWLSDLAREHGAEKYMEYLGPYDLSQLPKIMRASDIFVHLKHNDPCPSTVLEAMSSGLPVVFSASGGTPELVAEGGIGLPVPDSYEQVFLPEPDAIADAIEKILERPDEYSRIARERAVRLFSLESWLQKHKELFESFAV